MNKTNAETSAEIIKRQKLGINQKRISLDLKVSRTTVWRVLKDPNRYAQTRDLTD